MLHWILNIPFCNPFSRVVFVDKTSIAAVTSQCQ